MTKVSPPAYRARRADISLAGVYEISKLLSVPARLETILASVLRVLSNFLDLRHGLIALLDEHGVPEVVVGTGWNEAKPRYYFDRLPERAIGRIVVTGMPLIIERMKADSLFENWDFSSWGADEDSSFIGVPIKDRGNVVGTLTIDRENSEGHHFSFDEDVRFLTMIANLIGQTVRAQRLISQDRAWLMEEQRRLEKTLKHAAAPAERPVNVQAGGIIGATPTIRGVLDKVHRVARSNSPVLLRGESGTGKEMFAKALHAWSPRAKEAFVAVNCAALAESVLESELFGHEKGAFTGAVSQRKGRFELADGGTLFLDEIGEISPAFQAKLLRVLQLGEFERVGGTGTIKVNVRIVAATNRDLEEQVAQGKFRADLYYRISVLPIFLPPLRERRGDMPLLAREFLERFNSEHGTNLTLTDGALAVLTSCYFPGNVRELENCVRRTATLAHGICIVSEDFACRHDECLSSVLWKKSSSASGSRALPSIGQGGLAGGSVGSPQTPARPQSDAQPEGRSDADVTHTRETAMDSAATGEHMISDTEAERVISDRDRLIEAMRTAGWVQAKAARLLGLTPRQIGYALRKHDIPVKKF